MDVVFDEQELAFVPDLEKSAKETKLDRKQRLREYRVAARREKRNRKADEKKQRKLNATILRRMTRNPDKYNRNAERNRLRDIQAERRRIWLEAVKQAERLAAIYDPSGANFNVSPVVKQEDGTVISVDTLRKREEREASRHVNMFEGQDIVDRTNRVDTSKIGLATQNHSFSVSTHGIVNPDRLAQMDITRVSQVSKGMSKTQQKRLVALETQPPPPKPIIPENVSIPDGEEDWLALWDLSDDQLERRILREKRCKAAERKTLRHKQQSGKAERREARDEKRKTYRDIKSIWKAIKEEQTKHKIKLKSLEDEESKRIAVQVNILERRIALEHCAQLGFTLANTPGVDEIKPRALGMKGVEVDFDALEVGESPSTIRPKNTTRVDLSGVPRDHGLELLTTNERTDDSEEMNEFIKLDVGNGQDRESLNYNRKLRRKLRRAIENAEIQKEILVRERAVESYTSKNAKPPPELKTPLKPVNIKGQRILENGTLESAKQERVRTRLELAEYNKAARVLRKQAKQSAVEAGLRKHAKLIGKLSPSTSATNGTANGNAKTLDRGAIISAIVDPWHEGPNRSHWIKSESVPTNPKDSRFLKKRKRESEESDTSSETSGDSSASDSDNDIAEAKEKNLTPKAVTFSTINSQRQAMINAKASLAQTSKTRKEVKAEPISSLREVDTNADCKFQKPTKGNDGNSNWRYNELPGDVNRKSKFLRLLGAGKSSTGKESEGLNERAEQTPPLYKSPGVSTADLERQYERSMAQNQNTKRKGLGA